MIFGIGFSVAPIGEQPDNLEAIGRAAAYQDCHRHGITTILDEVDEKHSCPRRLHLSSPVQSAQENDEHGEPLLRPL
jgi:hypothetical protein